MSKSLLLGLMIIFLALNIRLLVKTNSLNKSLQEITNKEQTLGNINALLEINILYSSENNCTKIQDMRIAIDDSQMLLSEYVSDGPKLVFYSTVNYCSSCVEAQIKAFQDISERITKSNAFILFSDISKRDINIIRTTYNIKTDIVSLDKKAFGLTSDGVEVPLAFVIMPDLRIYDVIKLYKNMSPLTTQYYNNICRKYWSAK